MDCIHVSDSGFGVTHLQSLWHGGLRVWCLRSLELQSCMSMSIQKVYERVVIQDFWCRSHTRDSTLDFTSCESNGSSGMHGSDASDQVKGLGGLAVEFKESSTIAIRAGCAGQSRCLRGVRKGISALVLRAPARTFAKRFRFIP